MTSDERLIALKERAAAALMRDPAVTGVGLGGRERDGRPTGEIVLKVFVERKRPLADLTSGEVLPDRFEGLGVDVGELSAGRLHRASVVDDPEPPTLPIIPGSPPTTVTGGDFHRYRALVGGGNLQAEQSGAWYGTLGCLLRHTGDAAKVYALTAFHVLAETVGGPVVPTPNVLRVGQPNSKSSSTKCCSNLFGTFAGGGVDVLRDAALVQLDPGMKWRAEITGIGPVAGVHTVTVEEAATQTYQVRKRGSRTGLTGGTVVSINTTATTVEGITRNNLIVVAPNPYADPPNGPVFFADTGDSGSALVNDASEVVGMHFAGSVSGDVHKGFGLPIDVLIAQFQAKEGLPVAVATATAAGQDNVVPGAAPVASAAELPAMAGGLPPYPELLGRIGADLDRSAAGRRLLGLWLEHGDELLALVNGQRRVTIAWHRGGGPALLQTLIRVAADPELAVPPTINGESPARRLARIHAAFHAAASPELRRALEEALTALPDPAGLTYPQMLTALAAV